MRDLNKIRLQHNPTTFKNANEALAYCLRFCPHFRKGCAVDCEIRKYWKIPPHGPKYPEE
jgi:hypothetical protein